LKTISFFYFDKNNHKKQERKENIFNKKARLTSDICQNERDDSNPAFTGSGRQEDVKDSENEA
jgi:hypothetical protein